MLNIRQYLNTHSLADLEQEYSIKPKRHPQYPNLVLLKYNQIETKMIPMTRECRGIILDESDDWKVICYTFKRFANLNGESWGDKIDWETAKVQVKEDGSLCQLFYYDGSWHVASSGTPSADGKVGGFDITFKELFWQTFNELGYKVPNDTDLMLGLELCHHLNRVIVRHKKPRLVLHCVRRRSDLQELNPIVEGHYLDYEVVKSFPFISVDEVIEQANKLNPLEAEGFVVIDKNFNRAKVKGESYRRMAHFRDSLTTRSILDIARHNEGAEAFIGFEEYLPIFHKINEKYRELAGEVQGYYDAIKDIQERKGFARIASKKFYSDILFGLRDNKWESVKVYLAEMDIKHLEKWLNIEFKEL